MCFDLLVPSGQEVGIEDPGELVDMCGLKPSGSVYSLDQIHLAHWTWTGPSNCQLDQNGVFLGPILVGPGNHTIYLITMAIITCRSFS